MLVIARFSIVLLILVVAAHGFTLYRPTAKPKHHSGSDSRAVSENVDLDETDEGSYDRLKNVIANLNPRVGLMHSSFLGNE
ncbi:unnamed protein product [Caenorhabditis bovis]|uniref:Uncharacterized protein n=1 Tax=Caenorhabditis bovis TaxID=2654633 RepID=A0A8S1EGG2_9PELO|nr:unnamed protein product [Caenorhabditis bovis]